MCNKQKQVKKTVSITSGDYSGLKIKDLIRNRYFRHLQIKYLPRNKLTFRIKPDGSENKSMIVHNHNQAKHSGNNFF